MEFTKNVTKENKKKVGAVGGGIFLSNFQFNIFLWFGIDSVLKILNERMTQSINK